MYDELVKRLRETSCGAENTLWWQAADAIEELSKRVPQAPHGRLIDADEADSRFTPDFTELSDFQCGWNEAMKRVCGDALTVIPAGREEERNMSESCEDKAQIMPPYWAFAMLYVADMKNLDSPGEIVLDATSGCGKCDWCRLDDMGVCRYGEEQT